MSQVRKSETWGKVVLHKVEWGPLFAGIFREIEDSGRLNDDGTGFHHNLAALAQAYRDDRMYTLEVEESDDMFKRRHEDKELFMDVGCYNLPCVMTVDKDNEVVIIWVHQRARGRGFGRELMRLADVKKAQGVLEESEGFFRACGVEIVPGW